MCVGKSLNVETQYFTRCSKIFVFDENNSLLQVIVKTQHEAT